jgi:predicted amidohydrolase YtcJ
MPADRPVVLENARVWPAGDRLAVAGAVIGPQDADGERIDLGGATVVPGLVDAHVHFPSWALGRREPRLFGTRSVGEALERIEAAAKPADGWLRGRGWREEEWPEGERPTRAALDAVTGDVPTALRAHDGHTLWVNSAALAAGGGAAVIDDDGVLREHDAWDFFDTYAAATPAETLDAVRDALPAAHAAGVTGVHDKDGARGAPEAFAALREAGELSLRVWQSVPGAECGVSFEEALASFTVAPAWLEGAEQRRGRLSEGFDADLVVLDEDRVRATMVAGRWVHGHP